MLKKSLIIALVVLIAGTASGQSAAEKYIQAYKDAAIRAMNEHGVPAGI